MQSDLEMIDFNQDLPVKVFTTSIAQSKLHWHYAYEILFVLKGELQIFSEKKSFVLKAGDVYLFNSREIHAIHEISSNIVAIIQIDNRLLEKAESNHWRYHFYLNFQSNSSHSQHFDELRTLIADLVLHFNDQNLPSYYKTRGKIMLLIGDLFEDCVFDKQANQNEDTSTLDETIHFVDLLQQNLTVNDPDTYLSAQTGLDSHLIDINFQHNLGINTNQLMTRLRVQEAMRLLKTSKGQIDYIIDVCGFSSRRTFYREFKKIVGTTPLKYRNGRQKKPADTKIRGYVNYDNTEAIQLLRKWRDGVKNENQ